MRARRAIAVPVVLASLVAPAAAQVTTNSNALDQLGTPTHQAPRRQPPPRTPPHRTTTPAPHTASSAPAPTAAAPAKPAKPAIPATPPAILALPPPVAVPLAHSPPLPTVPVTDDAPGAATPIAGGVRVTFGSDRADLNPATAAALRQFADPLAKQTTSINIYAYATGSPEDPSTPRRLSLERALAARAVLLNAGIASPRIYPRALGPAGGSTDPDRVDVVAGPPAKPATPAPTRPAG